MSKRKQEVWMEVKFADGKTLSGPIEGCMDSNLRGKISDAVKLKLTQYNMDGGAVIKILISPAEADEYANPER